MLKLVPGWRYFQCENCACRWSEKCRDYATLSNSLCPECREFNAPYDSMPMPEWKTDAHGNLLED